MAAQFAGLPTAQHEQLHRLLRDLDRSIDDTSDPKAPPHADHAHTRGEVHMSAQTFTRSPTPDQAQPRSASPVANSIVAMEGGDIPVTRALPTRDVTYDLIDPWLMLDEGKLESFQRRFPTAPHRGFEILTDILQGIVQPGGRRG